MLPWKPSLVSVCTHPIIADLTLERMKQKLDFREGSIVLPPSLPKDATPAAVQPAFQKS